MPRKKPTTVENPKSLAVLLEGIDLEKCDLSVVQLKNHVQVSDAVSGRSRTIEATASVHEEIQDLIKEQHKSQQKERQDLAKKQSESQKKK